LGKIIAIAGNMGAGKTSMVEFLARKYDVVAGFEPNDDNPYLADFYQDMDRWAAHSQLFFLVKKAQLHRELQESDKPSLLDRSIYEDAEIFARNLYLNKKINKRDYALYCNYYDELNRYLKPPDLLIFLRCTFKSLKKRIAFRGREMEQDIDEAYLKRLNRLYSNWFNKYDLSPVIEIKSDKIDYVTDLTHQIDLLKMVEKALGV